MEQKNQVGQTLPNGYTVIANYRNRYILAHHSKAGEATCFSVWNTDQDGDILSNSCFKKQEDAEKYFANCCFNWLDVSTLYPRCFDDKEPTALGVCTETRHYINAVSVRKSEMPEKIHVDHPPSENTRNQDIDD